ncbi:MAG: HlyD family efflux transporter periplasmic adaptor subunit [Patescibacteria group bacterium]|jgi:HlyD family secretion protein
MKFPLSKKWIMFLTGLVLVILAVGYFATRSSGKEIYVTDAVKRADIKKTVDITGSLSPLSHADLSFQSNGNVAGIFVSVGQLVKRGQPLASLSASDLSADARRAQADLDLALASPKPEDIASAKADVTSADVAVRNAETALSITKTVNTVDLKNADDAVIKAKEDQATSLADTLRAVTTALQTGVIQIRTGLSKADQLLGIENTLFNDDFEREFSAENPQALQSAKDAFAKAVVDRNLAETAVVASSSTAIALTTRALEETSDTLLYTRQALDATAADSQALSLDDIVAYKTTIDTARTNVESARSALSTAVDAQTAETTASAHTVLTAELNAESAQANANKAEASANANVLTTKAELQKANSAYEKVIAPPRNVDIAPYLASRDGATARYLKTEIVSPIDGKIGKVDVKLGEAVTTGTAVISVEPTSATAYEVAVDVPESDVAHLALGDTATITFDAFGADVVFTGSLSSLDRSEKLIEGVVFYQAKIAVTDGPRLNDLRNGMSADVTVLTDSKSNVLTVPTRSILEINGQKLVRILVNDAIQEKPVVVGLRGDNSISEILSGLAEGDVVVVSIKK